MLKKILIKIFLIFSILFILLSGILSGLLLSGFFGTLDNPSNKIKIVAEDMGFTKLGDLRQKTKWIAEENIKIPKNYLVGVFSNPEKISIDISFKDYQKLDYKRRVAIERGVLFSSSEDYVSAKIRYGNKELDARIRLKGDNIGHLKENKWSFRIKLKGEDRLFGMKTFSIQDPKTRNYLNEFVFHKSLKNEDIISLRYEFIEVVINGKNRGIYALEEHFDKELLGNNNRIEGLIVKFNEDVWWEEFDKIENKRSFDVSKYDYLFFDAPIDSFQNKKIIKNKKLSNQFEIAKNLLENFRLGKLKTHEVFDIDKLSKYFSIVTVTCSGHGSGWTNIRFYYNPITSKLEPIGFDAMSSKRNCQISEDFNPHSPKSFYKLLFSDKVFYEKYLQELERISQKSYWDDLLSELNLEIERNINILYRDYPYYNFSIDFYKI